MSTSWKPVRNCFRVTKLCGDCTERRLFGQRVTNILRKNVVTSCFLLSFPPIQLQLGTSLFCRVEEAITFHFPPLITSLSGRYRRLQPIFSKHPDWKLHHDTWRQICLFYWRDEQQKRAWYVTNKLVLSVKHCATGIKHTHTLGLTLPGACTLIYTHT